MEVNELLKKVRKIDIKSRRRSDQSFSGDYHTKFKGRGMSFAEVREYQYSDDVKHIDWNVTARTGVPFVKVFEEERELTVMLLVDVSRSAFFGSKEQLKSELITEVSAVLAYSAIRNNDKVGLVLFSDKIEKFIPPAKSRDQTLKIIRELVDFEPTSHSTDIAIGLDFLNQIIKRRCICFLISDFLDEGYIKPIRIAARKNDLIAIHVSDPAEKVLPRGALFKAIDPETGREQWVDADDPAFRKAYTDWYVQHEQRLKKTLGRHNVSLIDLSTDSSYVKPLISFFKERRVG